MWEDKIACIKDVVMDESDDVVFTKGSVYKANFDSAYINAINNNGDIHCVGTRNDKDGFLQEHFIRVW